MPRKTPITDAKRWVEMADEGLNVSQIARKERRDPRTVSRAIEQVRQDRERREIRRDAVTAAYRQHWGHLLDRLEELEDALKPGDLEVKPVRPVYVEAQTEVTLGACRVDVSDRERPKARLSLQESPEWRLLAEHLSGDDLLRMVERWKSAVGEYVVSCLELAERVKTVLRDSTGLPLVKAEGQDPCVTLRGADLLYVAAVAEASGETGRLERLAQSLEASGEPRSIAVGNDLVARVPEGQVESQIEALRGAVISLQDAPELRRLGEALRSVLDYAEQAGEESAVIRAGKLLPGECRSCMRFTV